MRKHVNYATRDGLEEDGLIYYCKSVSKCTSLFRLTVHRLAARTLIRSLEMEARESRRGQDGGVKKKVVEISVQSGVSSTFTDFIAVNKGPLVRRNVPTPSECYFMKNKKQKPRCTEDILLLTMTGNVENYDDVLLLC